MTPPPKSRERKCRHQPTMHYGWHPSGYWYEAPYLARYQSDAVICDSTYGGCGAWLSLGPATHDRHAVEDEIAAAEFALRRDAKKLLAKPRACILGGRPHCERDGCDGCDIWDLARQIASHDERSE